MAKPEIEVEIGERVDVITKTGHMAGFTKLKKYVHRDGDYHRAVHIWIYAERTQELLLQQLAPRKGAWAGMWDMSAASHVSAGESSLVSARFYIKAVKFSNFLENIRRSALSFRR